MFNHRFDEIEKQTKGIVFNIEHFHVHDGEGIRTNVFLKGCSLHCPWCCNPESIHPGPQIAQYQKLCTGCGKCVEVCPKHLIELIPYDSKYAVACSSKDKGPVTMKDCTVGCIGCQLCKKNCPSEAVEIADFHASIDYEKCTGCGTCMEKCPRKSIIKI